MNGATMIFMALCRLRVITDVEERHRVFIFRVNQFVKMSENFSVCLTMIKKTLLHFEKSATIRPVTQRCSRILFLSVAFHYERNRRGSLVSQAVNLS